MKQSAFEVFWGITGVPQVVSEPLHVDFRTGGCLAVLESKSLLTFHSFTHSQFCTAKPFTAYKEVAKVPLGSSRSTVSSHQFALPSLIFSSPEFGLRFMNLLSHTYRIRETCGLLLNSPLHFPVSVGLMKWTAFYGWIIRSNNLRAKRERKKEQISQGVILGKANIEPIFPLLQIQGNKLIREAAECGNGHHTAGMNYIRV